MKVSIVASVYNEELSLKLFHEETTRFLKSCVNDYEIIFVNDGSSDDSLSVIKEIMNRDDRVGMVSFSRNFGHEAAMIAGIDYATGDGIICMDSDLQHPPETIPEILAKFEEGYDVISMVRTANKKVGLIKKVTSKGFYKVLNALSPVRFEENASDFFALSARAAKVLRQDYRERVRFLRGMVQIIGFNKTALEYEAHDRVAGESKYSIKKLIRFSYNALCSFSDVPLRLGIYAGVMVGLIGLIIMIYSIISKFVYGAPAGYPTLIVVICFMFFVTLVSIGIIGEYLAVLFTEIKGRPIYLVRDVYIPEKENDDEINPTVQKI